MKINYLNLLNINFYHGIMFHHFHDNIHHKKSQGSINALEFERILKFIGLKNILEPKKFIDLMKKKKLKKNHVCLTFDDNLKCQYDIAAPILKKYNLKAFFFIYSSSLTRSPDLLEIFRYFRSNCYKNISSFYKDFNTEIYNQYEKKEINNFFKKNTEEIFFWKRNFLIYSNNDIKFRFLRDKFLSKNDYEKIMLKLFKKKKFNSKKILQNLFMSNKNLISLEKSGHEIGLHSDSHPTKMEILDKKKQMSEYMKNKKKLDRVMKKKIISMSHPCGSYNDDTIKILKRMKIDIGFRSDLRIQRNSKNFKFEIPRTDHSIIINLMKNL